MNEALIEELAGIDARFHTESDLDARVLGRRIKPLLGKIIATLRSQPGTLAREEVARIIHGDDEDWEDLLQASMSNGPRQKYRDQVSATYAKADAILALTPSHEAGTQEPVACTMRETHTTKPIKVWIDADVGIADFVLELNDIPGIRTLTSCQGGKTYGPQVMVQWENDDALKMLSRFRMTRLGPSFGYVHPIQAQNKGT